MLKGLFKIGSFWVACQYKFQYHFDNILTLSLYKGLLRVLSPPIIPRKACVSGINKTKCVITTTPRKTFIDFWLYKWKQNHIKKGVYKYLYTCNVNIKTFLNAIIKASLWCKVWLYFYNNLTSTSCRGVLHILSLPTTPRKAFMSGINCGQIRHPTTPKKCVYIFDSIRKIQIPWSQQERPIQILIYRHANTSFIATPRKTCTCI